MKDKLVWEVIAYNITTWPGFREKEESCALEEGLARTYYENTNNACPDEVVEEAGKESRTCLLVGQALCLPSFSP